MSGTIIENLSGRKLAVLVSFLIACQITCFLIGGLVAPMPTNAQSVLGSVCKDTTTQKNDTTKWFYILGEGKCDKMHLDQLEVFEHYGANDIVFAFQMPLRRDGRILDYSRWQQNLIGVLQPDIKYNSHLEITPHSQITIDARLAYRNKGDPEYAWKLYTQSIETRPLDCQLEQHMSGYGYDCTPIPLFELGSLFHDYYLLNIRLPVDEKGTNMHIGQLTELHLTVINQNGGFTKVWLSLKTVFFPCTIAIMYWFWRRVHMLSRKPVLLEKMLLALGLALSLLNLPLEYMTLTFDMPFMLLLSDIRQGVFYATLFSFWLVFAGEHMLVQDTTKSTIQIYWKHLSAVGIGCISLFIFDICERGVQLRNPFYSIWVTNIGTKLALTFIILAGISTGMYFLFLCYMIWKVFCNISQKRATLPGMSSVRRLHYEGIIYRFKFMMLETLLCAALTVTGYILGQVSEGQWKWDDDINIEYSSAIFTGVYGMWNIYTFALLILYAPSHKNWPVNEHTSDSQHLSEEIECSRLSHEQSTCEISSLTSFIRKTATE